MKEDELGIVYNNGETIFEEGEKGEVMYVIQSGKVKITKKTDSEEVAIATLKDGETFGEMALFDRLPRSATATSVGESRILSIDKKKFFSTISRDPTVVFGILETMSRRIRKINEEFTKLKKDRAELLRAGVNIDEICNLLYMW